MKRIFSKIAFAFFAVCLMAAAFLFNFEMILLSVIFFIAALIFGVVMACLSRLVAREDRSGRSCS